MAAGRARLLHFPLLSRPGIDVARLQELTVRRHDAVDDGRMIGPGVEIPHQDDRILFHREDGDQLLRLERLERECRPLEIDLEVGIDEVVALAPFEDALDPGLLLGARFGYRLSPTLVIEAGYRYSPNGRFSVSFEDRLLGPVELEAPNDRGSHAFQGNLRFELRRGAGLRPFLVGGLGLERFGKGSTSPRWNAGGGAVVSLRPGLSARLDAQYVLWTDFLGSGRTADGVEVYFGLVLGL